MLPRIISLVSPPFPTFIEGNKCFYTKGQSHPTRNNLPYFDVILVQQGTLYITADNIDYTITKDEMLILTPYQPHHSTKVCGEDTSFYWFHFQHDGAWKETEDAIKLSSNFNIPDRHYHNEDFTLHFYKKHFLKNARQLHNYLDDLLQNTTHKSQKKSFWDNQELFIRILKYLEKDYFAKPPAIALANNIEEFIKENYMYNISNTVLSEHFHFHTNYLISCMKKEYGATPMEFLNNYRLSVAVDLLENTNLSIQEISNKTGFKTCNYFSLCFKKHYGKSPSTYRKSHSLKVFDNLTHFK